MIQIGFTGTRRGMTESQRKKFRELIKKYCVDICLHHGDCIGADAQAHKEALVLNAKVVIHPPDNLSARAFCKGAAQVRDVKPYLERNRAIVDETLVLYAAPGEFAEQTRSGTWATIRYARKLGRKIYLILPDGKVGYPAASPSLRRDTQEDLFNPSSATKSNGRRE